MILGKVVESGDLETIKSASMGVAETLTFQLSGAAPKPRILSTYYIKKTGFSQHTWMTEQRNMDSSPSMLMTNQTYRPGGVQISP